VRLEEQEGLEMEGGTETGVGRLERTKARSFLSPFFYPFHLYNPSFEHMPI